MFIIQLLIIVNFRRWAHQLGHCLVKFSIIASPMRLNINCWGEMTSLNASAHLVHMTDDSYSKKTREISKHLADRDR